MTAGDARDLPDRPTTRPRSTRSRSPGPDTLEDRADELPRPGGRRLASGPPTLGLHPQRPYPERRAAARLRRHAARRRVLEHRRARPSQDPQPLKVTITFADAGDVHVHLPDPPLHEGHGQRLVRRARPPRGPAGRAGGGGFAAAPSAFGAVRESWVAAVPVTWNMVPNGHDAITGIEYDTAQTVVPHGRLPPLHPRLEAAAAQHAGGLVQPGPDPRAAAARRGRRPLRRPLQEPRHARSSVRTRCTSTASTTSRAPTAPTSPASPAATPTSSTAGPGPTS